MPNDKDPSDDLQEILDRERARSRWPWVAVLVLAVLAAGAGGLWYFLSPSATVAQVRFRTADVARGDLEVIVSATGTLKPVNQVDVGSELSGTIRSVRVDFNDAVTRGQVLAELDTDKLEAQRDQARASLDVSRAELENARAGADEARINLERLERAFEASGGRLPSRQDLDAARAAHDKARAQVNVARANIARSEAALKGFESDLGKAIIRSPIDGLVLNRQVEPGQTVAASLQAPILFTLAETLTGMDLSVAVDEADVGEVREGLPATFVVDAYPERRFPARIRQVRFAPQEVSGVVTYECILEVDNQDLLLRPGMTATADIVTTEVKGAVLVPNLALRFTPTGIDAPAARQESSGGSFISRLMPGPPRTFRPRSPNDPAGKDAGGARVWVLESGRPAPRTVVVGPSDGVHSQILSGDIAPGQAVITGQEAAQG